MPKPSGTQTYPERLERFKNLLNQSITLHRAKGQYIVERKPSSLALEKAPRIPPGMFSAN